jgi:hypothetical protein
VWTKVEEYVVHKTVTEEEEAMHASVEVHRECARVYVTRFRTHPALGKTSNICRAEK